MDLKSKYEDPDEPAYKDEEIQKFFSSFDRSQSGSDLKENFLRLRGQLAGGPESLQTRNQELIQRIRNIESITELSLQQIPFSSNI